MNENARRLHSELWSQSDLGLRGADLDGRADLDDLACSGEEWDSVSEDEARLAVQTLRGGPLGKAAKLECYVRSSAPVAVDAFEVGWAEEWKRKGGR